MGGAVSYGFLARSPGLRARRSGGPLTWSPADIQGAISLSGDLLTATYSPGSGRSGVRGAKYFTGELVYVEFVWTNALSSDRIGLSVAGTDMTSDPLGVAAGQLGYAPSGTIIREGTNLGTRAEISAGQRLCMALNMSLGKAWFRANNGNWGSGQNPETGAGGYAIPAGALTVAFGSSAFAQGSVVTLARLAGEWAYAPPSGYGEG